MDKYEYLTGEDLDYKPDAVEQAILEYSPLGKVFKKEFKEEYKKQGLLKRLRSIEEKNEEQLQVFSKANKISWSAKNESDYNYNNKFTFYRFYRDVEKFLKRSLGSRYNEISEFFKFLSEFKMRKVITAETRECTKRITNNVVKLYGDYFDSYEQTYDKESSNEKEKLEPKQFKIAFMEHNCYAPIINNGPNL